MSLLYIVPDRGNYRYSLLLAETYSAHFAYGDFSDPQVLDDPIHLNHIINGYLENGNLPIGNLLLGIPGLDCFNDDNNQRIMSEKRVSQSIVVATLLGAATILFRSGRAPRVSSDDPVGVEWVRRAESFWRSVLDRNPSITLYIENSQGSYFPLFRTLADRFRNEPRFRICLDYVESIRSNDSPETWFESLGKQLQMIRIHDIGVDGGHPKSLGEGTIDWQAYIQLLNRYRYSGDTLLNLNETEKHIKSLHYMMHHRFSPF